jgi:hypothetical protein
MEHKHKFVELPSQQARRGYYKLFEGETMRYDHSVAYTMLYCPECGTTKEVIAADYRKQLDESSGFAERFDNLQNLGNSSSV